MKKITIIVPVFNVRKYLRRGIDSLVRQKNFQDLEIIIVNDGSTDGSNEILEEYDNKYNNIMLINKTNGGVSSARNTALDQVKTKYVCFFDPDDIVKDDFYTKLFDLIEEKKSDIAMVDYYITYSDKEKYKKRKSKKYDISDNFRIMKSFFKGGVTTNNIFDKIFLNNTIKGLKFIEGKKVGEDMYFLYQALKRTAKFSIDTSYCGYFYYQNSESAMNSEMTDRFMDSIYFSKLMLNDYQKEEKLYEYAYAHLIYEYCKLKEIILLKDKKNIYHSNLYEINKNIKKYKIFYAIKYLNYKHLIYYLIMNKIPRVYVYLKKKEKKI